MARDWFLRLEPPNLILQKRCYFRNPYIGAMLLSIFILFIGYLMFLKMHGVNLYEIAMNIEKLQRDMLFEEIDETVLKERIQKVCPYLNQGFPRN